MSLENLFTRSWYGGGCGWTQIFRPLQPIVRRVVTKKRNDYLGNPDSAYRAPVPVIVVGNISVGGTGKSPMVVALCKLLARHGFRPGIVSRGHGVNLKKPTQVTSDSLASEVGHEPVMLTRRTGCPMVVYPKRDEAAHYLLQVSDVDVIISDDGMQHYRLHRDIEVAMLDAKRGVGNGQLIPVGPLREPVSRLGEVDFVVSISEDLSEPLQALNFPVIVAPLIPGPLLSLDGARTLSLNEAFSPEKTWHVIAGIGNPQRFMLTLEGLGLKKEKMTNQWFSDHHAFETSDIPNEGSVIMTEKDAVKCQALALDNQDVWYLPVSLSLPEAFESALLDKINHLKLDCTHE